MKASLIKKSLPRFTASILPRLALLAAALLLAFAPGRALAQRALGVDVSSYQGSGINWSSVHGSGRTFAWAKATEGTYNNDADFVGNENNGKGAGMAMGAYHFARPDLDSPGTEANFFWSAAGGYIKADGKTLMPMLDMETWNGVVGASSYSDWANQWNNSVAAKALAQGVTIKPFIYTSACSACNFNSSVAGWNSDLANYNGENPQSGSPWNVCGNCDAWGSGVWAAWQYSSTVSVPGISGGVDADVINGGSVSPYVAQSPSGGTSPTPCVLRNSDGRLELFAIQANSMLAHDWQTTPSGSWQGWNLLTAAGCLTVTGVQNKDGRLEVFMIGTDHQANHVWQTTPGGSWTANSPMGGWFSSLAAITNQDGRIEIFGVGSDAYLYHNWQTTLGGNWQGWTLLDTAGHLFVTATIGTNGCIDVFSIGTDHQANYNRQTTPGGGWAGNAPLGGWHSSLAAARNLDGTMELFGVGLDAFLYHNKETTPGGAWTGWTLLDSAGHLYVTVVQNGDGRLETFSIGTDHQANHDWQSVPGGSWSGNYPLGGWHSGLCAGRNLNNNLEIFGIGQDKGMWHNWQPSWAGWLSLGGNLE